MVTAHRRGGAGLPLDSKFYHHPKRRRRLFSTVYMVYLARALIQIYCILLRIQYIRKMRVRNLTFIKIVSFLDSSKTDDRCGTRRQVPV